TSREPRACRRTSGSSLGCWEARLFGMNPACRRGPGHRNGLDVRSAAAGRRAVVCGGENAPELLLAAGQVAEVASAAEVQQRQVAGAPPGAVEQCDLIGKL